MFCLSKIISKFLPKNIELLVVFLLTKSVTDCIVINGNQNSMSHMQFCVTQLDHIQKCLGRMSATLGSCVLPQYIYCFVLGSTSYCYLNILK